MGEFFNSVAGDYDEVHTSHINQGGEFYLSTAALMLPSERPVSILNLGAATGLDLATMLSLIIGDRYVSHAEAKVRCGRYETLLAAGIHVTNGQHDFL